MAPSEDLELAETLNLMMGFLLKAAKEGHFHYPLRSLEVRWVSEKDNAAPTVHGIRDPGGGWQFYFHLRKGWIARVFDQGLAVIEGGLILDAESLTTKVPHIQVWRVWVMPEDPSQKDGAFVYAGMPRVAVRYADHLRLARTYGEALNACKNDYRNALGLPPEK